MEEKAPAEDDPGELTDYSDDGVDLTLIRRMLSLTPSERLDALQQHARAILEIRAQTRAQTDRS